MLRGYNLFEIDSNLFYLVLFFKAEFENSMVRPLCKCSRFMIIFLISDKNETDKLYI